MPTLSRNRFRLARQHHNSARDKPLRARRGVGGMRAQRVSRSHPRCHRPHRNDEVKQSTSASVRGSDTVGFGEHAAWIATGLAALAMTTMRGHREGRLSSPPSRQRRGVGGMRAQRVNRRHSMCHRPHRHCERSEAIHEPISAPWQNSRLSRACSMDRHGPCGPRDDDDKTPSRRPPVAPPFATAKGGWGDASAASESTSLDVPSPTPSLRTK